jgi:hypothetical protein
VGEAENCMNLIYFGRMKHDRNYATASLPAILRCSSGVDGHIAHSGINRRRRWLVSLHPFGLTSKKVSSTHDDGSISTYMPRNTIRKRVTRCKDKKKLKKEIEDAEKGRPGHRHDYEHDTNN